MNFTVALAVVLFVSGISERDFLDHCKPMEFHYTGGKYQSEAFQYQLFDPRTDDGNGQKFPLIVWLHGLGEAGCDNLRQLNWIRILMDPDASDDKRLSFFVLAVQCPLDNKQWFRSDKAAKDDMLAVMVSILDETLRRFPIDRDRVYLTGISSGARGCWMLASRYPDYFAAVAPMSAPIRSRGNFALKPRRLRPLRRIPVWAFHCTDDPGAPIEPVKAAVDALAQAGGIVRLTMLSSASHDSWTAAFSKYKLRDWLLAQRRNDPASPLPGTITLYRNVAILCCAVCENPMFKVFLGWTWIPLVEFGYLTMVIAVVSRWLNTRRRTAPLARSADQCDVREKEPLAMEG